MEVAGSPSWPLGFSPDVSCPPSASWTKPETSPDMITQVQLKQKNYWCAVNRKGRESRGRASPVPSGGPFAWLADITRLLIFPLLWNLLLLFLHILGGTQPHPKIPSEERMTRPPPCVPGTLSFCRLFLGPFFQRLVPDLAAQ